MRVTMLSSKTAGGLPSVRIPSFSRANLFKRANRFVLIPKGIAPAKRFRTYAEKVQEEQQKEIAEKSNPEEVTKKWGLEAGLFKAVTSKQDGQKNSGATAKELLKKYGSAYLITSISFAIVSFVICYILVDLGVDVASLLGKIGITVSGTGEKLGTAAIAYAAHKAASPIRFPPTVALTPVVANWIGRKQDEDKTSE